MSKFTPLWEYVAGQQGSKLLLSFGQVEEICGLPIDHSFLNCKKELLAYGWQVNKAADRRFGKDQSIENDPVCRMFVFCIRDYAFNNRIR